MATMNCTDGEKELDNGKEQREERWVLASGYIVHGQNIELRHLLLDLDMQAAVCHNAWTWG